MTMPIITQPPSAPTLSKPVAPCQKSAPGLAISKIAAIKISAINNRNKKISQPDKGAYHLRLCKIINNEMALIHAPKATAKAIPECAISKMPTNNKFINCVEIKTATAAHTGVLASPLAKKHATTGRVKTKPITPMLYAKSAAAVFSASAAENAP